MQWVPWPCPSWACSPVTNDCAVTVRPAKSGCARSKPVSRTATPMPRPDSARSPPPAWMPQVNWVVSSNSSGAAARGHGGQAVVVRRVQHPLGQVVDAVAICRGCTRARPEARGAPAPARPTAPAGRCSPPPAASPPGRDPPRPRRCPGGRRPSPASPASPRASCPRRRSHGCRRRWRCRPAPSRRHHRRSSSAKTTIWRPVVSGCVTAATRPSRSSRSRKRSADRSLFPLSMTRRPWPDRPGGTWGDRRGRLRTGVCRQICTAQGKSSRGC